MKMEQYRKSLRAKFIDYDYGDYFITICTKDKRHFFGKIIAGEMILSDVGHFLNHQLSQSDAYSRDVKMIYYVVMPNHVHAIVRVTARKSDAEINIGFEHRSPNPALRCKFNMPKTCPYIK